MGPDVDIEVVCERTSPHRPLGRPALVLKMVPQWVDKYGKVGFGYAGLKMYFSD